MSFLTISSGDKVSVCMLVKKSSGEEAFSGEGGVAVKTRECFE